MKHSIIFAKVALGTTALLLGCSDPNGGGGDDGDDGENGGSSGTGTGGSGNSGTSGTSGTGAECSNSNRMTLPIDEAGWVARECNDRNIQGAFYCYDDGINPTSCPMPAAVP